MEAKKLNIKNQLEKELLNDFMEIASYDDVIIERAFKQLTKKLSEYGLNEIKENLSMILKLTYEEAAAWKAEQEKLEFEYRYDGEVPGELESRMERESEGRYLNNLYKKESF